MKKALVVIGAFVALLDPEMARGQVFEPFSQWRLDASLPLQYTTNALLAPINTQSDFYVSPSVKLSALGQFDPTLKYRIYVAGNPDAYLRVTTADDGAATAGGRIDKTFWNFTGGNFSAGAIYNHNLVFDGIYRKLLFQADDFSGYVGYGYENKAAGFSIAPSFMTTYRVADLASQERFLFTLKTDITQALSENLSFTFTPTLRYYAFTEGTAAGKRNTLPSIVGALTYKLNNDVSLAGSVEFDRRWSNVAGNDYSTVIFLASINFGHSYDWPKIGRAP